MKLELVFDLETVRDESVPFPTDPRFELDILGENSAIYDAHPFPPPPCHQIVCIGYALFEDGIPIRLATVTDITIPPAFLPDESALLHSFLGYLEGHHPLHPKLISFNGRGFDIPVLMARAMKYKIACPWWWHDRNTRYRYSDQGHLDLKDQLSDFGASRAASLDQYCKLLGLPGKPEGIDGGSVGERMARGELDQVKAYCLTDVLQTALLWLRFELLRGNVTEDHAKESVTKLRELAEAATLPEGFQIAWEHV